MSRAIKAAELESLLQPPTNAEVQDALAQFTTAIRDHYSDRLRGVYLFGSRARGEHRPDSDADIAVVLQDGDWSAWIERRVLNQLAYPPSLERGLAIQPWPFSERQWLSSDSQTATALIVSARRDAVPLQSELRANSSHE